MLVCKKSWKNQTIQCVVKRKTTTWPNEKEQNVTTVAKTLYNKDIQILDQLNINIMVYSSSLYFMIKIVWKKNTFKIHHAITWEYKTILED